MSSPAETFYVLIKRDLYECPRHQGYTGIRENAGTWPREGVPSWLPVKDKYDRSHEHYALAIDAAPEFTNACFDDLARDHLKAKCTAQDAEIAKLREALKPFAAMIERSDAMDVEFLARTAPGIDLEIYTPSTDKLVGSGEMRNAVYVTRGDFRRAWAALNQGASDA